jgi:hypothetical protein
MKITEREWKRIGRELRNYWERLKKSSRMRGNERELRENERENW